MSTSPTTQPSTKAELHALVSELREQAMHASSDAEMRHVTSRIAQVTRTYRIAHGIGIPVEPALQAVELDPNYVVRPHIDYLSKRIANAVRDVERGKNRHLAVSMPPRSGKTRLISIDGPVWMLRRHPEWEIALVSHDGALSTSWARTVRNTIEGKPDLGIAIAKDGGAGGIWQTEEQGGMLAISTRGSFTGRGARVIIIDDPIKDFVDAHSLPMRQALWDWWLSVAQTRLEPPYLVITVMTRWHEDDFIGRLFSADYEGDPREWERISLPAIAETDDVLGRAVGEPLLSPLLKEGPKKALERWASVKKGVGTYTFSAMYQQRPAPAKGAIFDAGWWRYWTSNPDNATEDGRVVFLDPGTLTGARWLDSWDASFKSRDEATGGWVVGQRWARQAANRYLISQKRGRWSFTKTIEQMNLWAVTDNPSVSPCGHLVHTRLIEERANGAAIIDVLKEHIAGLKPINPTVSKEARARAVTPEIESGNVYIPYPGDPGNEWVPDFLSELRNFPHDASDDQVDALTQGLSGLRDTGRGGITVPGGRTNRPVGAPGWQVPRDIARAALTDINRARRSG